jgi:peptidoglycan hydrolase-like protein with peptidoglycan-binding domain
MHHRIGHALRTLVLLTVVSATTLTLQAPAAEASYPVPPTPSGLSASIETIQPYVGQSTCDPVAKPGVAAFRNLLLRTYTDSGSFGIVRDCGAGGQSEHKEGRAFDWKVSAYNSHQAAEAGTLLSWLLKTDQYGNKYAMARRFGIMYMIWNHRIFKLYDAGRGWQAYSGASQHTDHVHFSFGWNGAKKTTSYWDRTVAAVDFGPNGPPHITPVRSVANIATVRQYGGTTLAMHSTGPAVSLIQKTLRVSPVDGDFGSDTGTHVMRFQVDQKLPMTGRFGLAEWKKLFPFPVSPFGGVDAPAYVLGNGILRGWALVADTTGPVDVTATFDGALAATVTAVTPRSDVAKSYPEYGGNHGFTVSLPVVDDGSHEVCLVARNAGGTPGTNTSLGCSTVSAQHNPVGGVSSLTSALGSVTLTGWALDPDSPDVLQTSLTVDGVASDVVPEAVTRTDIGLRFPGVGDLHGVRALLDLTQGTHSVCLLVPNAADTPGSPATVGCSTVTVEHTPVGVLESVRRQPGGVGVRGWALDPDVTGPATVDLLSDGHQVATVTAALTRLDLPTTYARQGTGHGFSAVLGLTAGTHQVCAKVHNVGGTPGTDRTLTCQSLVVTNDAAGAVAAVRTIPGGSIRATGDAYDPDISGASTVTALVDGKVARTITALRASSTAAARWPSYGSAHGFLVDVTASAGRHQLCLRAENAVGTPGAAKVLGCRTLWVHDGIGNLSSLSRSARTVTVRGWVLDPDAAKANVALLVVDRKGVTSVTAGRYSANVARAVPGYGSYHGFSFTRTLSRGTHTVCIQARNLAGTPGTYRTVGCRTVTVA